MKVMIMAAGKGTRLGKITEKIPKALVDIKGRSALQIAVESCTASGFDDIIVNVHHFADLVEEEILFLRKMGYRITVSEERETILETGGGLYNARHFFDDAPFLLYNVDILTDIILQDLYNFHIKENAIATLAVRKRSDNRYFLINNKGLISGWCNKTTGERILAGNPDSGLEEIAFSGLHIISPEIFQYMRKGIYTMTSLYLDLASFKKIQTFRHDSGYWFDIGTPENLEEARKIFSQSPE